MSGPADVWDGRLLLDVDGDGFTDALDGQVWIGTADTDAAVEAAAELLAALAARALVLPIEARTWPTTRPALFFGGEPPSRAEDPPTPAPPSPDDLPPGASLRRSSAGLLLAAPDGASLREAARVLAARRLRQSAAGAPTTDGVAPTGADASVPAGVAAHAATSLSLGRAMTGGGLFSGTPAWPLRFVGGFASRGQVPAAVEVAARLATEGLAPAVPLLGAPNDARVHVVVDPALGDERWEIRIEPRNGRDVLEIAGGDAGALARACRVFARSFPRLPDGSSLQELEPALERFLGLQSRDGRLAAAALAAPGRAISFELPYPGARAPRILGAPVRNGSRAGARRLWTHQAPWEGERLLAASARLALPDGPYTVEAYASETYLVRQDLARALSERLAAAGRAPSKVVVRHATKPALHWLLEEVAPALPATTATLNVAVVRQEERYGAAERWLRELYPVAELLERDRPRLEVQVALQEEAGPPVYLAIARDHAGAELARFRLAPPTVPSPLPGDGEALTTTGAVRLVVAGAVAEEHLVPTDREEVWAFLVSEVFPALTASLVGQEPPFLHEIAVIVHASEPDDRLPLDHETDSVLEGLHEDIYFGLLEAFGAARPGAGPRRLGPARILPFCHAAPAAAARVTVVARAAGSDAVAARTREGELVPAPPADAEVRATRLAGRGQGIESLDIELSGPGAGPALERLAWGARQRLETFPQGIALTFRAGGEERRVAAIVPGASARPEPLPARPLHPHEVARHARAWAQAEPRLHLRVAHESVLGQPLICLETGQPAGPNASRARRAAWKPTVLVSARQHANEPTSTPAVLELLRAELARPRFAGQVNLVVHPLENPDGARLHAALCSLAPNHMHHAARYTAFGADLQADPNIDGRLIGESAQRHETWQRWRPAVHLNNHGYPAHEWTRPQTGYLPTGFVNWSLPVGHLTIFTLQGAEEAEGRRLLAALRRRVAAALEDVPQIVNRTRAQVTRSGRYRPTTATPFRFERGLPFWETVRPSADVASSAPSPPLLVITEVPDETVKGGLWDACVLAHQLIDEAVLAALAGATAARGAAATGEPAGDEDLAPLALLARHERHAAAASGSGRQPRTEI